MRRCRHGFTLVELLVVIGIIAVLIGILMPTLARARAQATRLACTSNVRQILLACSMYENESRTFCPWPNWRGPEVAGYRPPGWLYRYPKGTTAAATQIDVEDGSLYNYLNTTEVYHCPIDRPPYTAGPTQTLTSYTMNGSVCSYGKKLPSYQITIFQQDAVMFWEADPKNAATWTQGASYPSQGISDRHSTGGTVGFFDGHAEWWSKNSFQSEAAKLPGRLWCNPMTKGGN